MGDKEKKKYRESRKSNKYNVNNLLIRSRDNGKRERKKLVNIDCEK